jgi:hypothetical protein
MADLGKRNVRSCPRSGRAVAGRPGSVYYVARGRRSLPVRWTSIQALLAVYWGEQMDGAGLDLTLFLVIGLRLYGRLDATRLCKLVLMLLLASGVSPVLRER